MAALVAAQRRTLRETAHRPWPLPERPWLMGQTWERLLFAHWALDPDVLRRVVPAQLPLDTFDGRAWLGVTPFAVRALHARRVPPLPHLSRFPELNVRTYVTVGGRPGIYFLSLDAARLAAVFAARRAYRLPYFHARMDVDSDGEWTRYRSERQQGDGPPAAFAASYRAIGAELPVRPGSLERWLAERYCLYTLDERRHVLCADIHHPPWPLREAEAEIAHNTMAGPFGITLEESPLLHLCERQDVVIWPLRPVAG